MIFPCQLMIEITQGCTAAYTGETLTGTVNVLGGGIKFKKDFYNMFFFNLEYRKGVVKMETDLQAENAILKEALKAALLSVDQIGTRKDAQVMATAIIKTALVEKRETKSSFNRRKGLAPSTAGA